MNFKSVFLILLFIAITGLSSAHKRALYNVVIDTDGGQDDFRAISLFCASLDFNINAITSTDGVLEPDQTASYIQLLMNDYGHQGIPIGIGKNRKIKKAFQKHALIGWDNLYPVTEKPNFQGSDVILYEAIVNKSKTTIIVALGPLGNIADLLIAHPEIKSKIGMILWYNSDPTLKTGYNIESDKEAFNYLNSLHIAIKIISNTKDYKYNPDFFNDLDSLDNVYANTFKKFNKAFTGTDIMLWDELTALYLSNVSFFSESYNQFGLPVLQPIEPFYGDVLAGAVLNINKAIPGVVFSDIPSSDYWIMPDIRNQVNEIIKVHGYQEFKIVSMASEFHSHLGIYSIIGAKMGLRAMEYFHAGLDEIEVVSYAGSVPPLSCMNDGLQYGTGATLGYGNISIDTAQLWPAAIISYNHKSIIISLKPEIQEQINADISKLVSKYGIDSELYWTELRKLSIQYWLEWDRKAIFDIGFYFSF